MKTFKTLSVMAMVWLFISCSEGLEDLQAPNASNLKIISIEGGKSNDANARKGGPQNSQPVYAFSDPATPIQGSSTGLNRGPNGISMSFKLTEAIPGQAYTVWFVIFNEPGNCSTTPCSEGDIFNPDTQTDVTYAGGAVTGNTNLTVSGHRSVGDTQGSAIPFFNNALNLDPPLPVFGLINPQGAEVHLVVRCHGPKVPENMPDQIKSFAGGCTNFLDPPDLPVNEGDCGDTHFSIHLPA